jgi:hypothetical protein
MPNNAFLTIRDISGFRRLQNQAATAFALISVILVILPLFSIFG